MDADLAQLSAQVGAWLKGRGLRLATAESCTGGWVAQVVTATAGSSDWFERGFVTYSNEAKQELLGVSGQTLQRQGAVSEQTAAEMALGALAASPADVALAITGVAGPCRRLGRQTGRHGLLRLGGAQVRDRSLPASISAATAKRCAVRQLFSR